MKTPLNVIILAAGQGKRMNSDLPKVLHSLGGRPLLSHVLDAAKSLDPEKICIVYGHGGDQIKAQFADAGVIWAEQNRQLGTGHAVMQALPQLDANSTTLVLCGDVPLIQGETLACLIRAAAQGVGILTMTLDAPAGYGRIVRKNGQVVRIVEEKDASTEERAISEINTGVIVAPTAHLKRWLAELRPTNAQGEYYLTDIIALASSEGISVQTAQPDDEQEILGVNTRVQLAQIEKFRRQKLAHKLMNQGVTLADPDRIDVRGTLECGRDCYIDVNCVFEGNVVLGDKVHIGPFSVVRDTRIMAGTRIEAYCHINDADIGRDCRIGPYARVRPGTILKEEVHLGNFVEVKATLIGAGSKANHLSYLGDSEIGKNVNVGAGTITCNYDGVNKHRTVIEDDVFIGSDTQLVAPVRVGRGATLGAGTTLTHDAPEEKLTLSRAKQITSAKWTRPRKGQ
jgi:bifunctional UDP-N-acetylglucosamine pyrophosphorylase / glucosamine-1-phosphate N-acetyltransferase